MLCFQANRSPLVINDPFFPFHSSIEEVTGIHLNTGLIRIYLEYYTGLRRRQTGSDSRKISFSVQYKIMVVTVSIFQLNKIITVYLPSDFFRLSEVHRRSGHRNDLTRCHKGTVDRSIPIRIHIQQMIRSGNSRITRQIEIRVIRHIDHRFLICHSLVLNIDSIIICKMKAHFRPYISREILIAIRRKTGQFESRTIDLIGFIHLILPTFRPTV